jgi:hypothetical protein
VHLLVDDRTQSVLEHDLLRPNTGELEQLHPGLPDGVRPVFLLGAGDTSGDLVEQVGGRDPVERRIVGGGECVEGLYSSNVCCRLHIEEE